jgi:hypothetical protein
VALTRASIGDYEIERMVVPFSILEAWRIPMRFIGVATFATAVLSFAPSLAQNIPAYAPSSDYRKLTCSELAQEGRAISKKGFMLSGLEAGRGGSEGTETSPAIVIVWPVTPPDGDGKRSENLALALRQLDAIEQATIASQCSIRFQRPPGT